MSVVQASCPACGAAIQFKVGTSLVAVCTYCHSVVARGDRKLKDLGKVAEVMETGAVLELGLKGRYEEVPFELTGRAQLGHEAGGAWDEWYAAFTDGRWGWLAEAQGRYYLTFEQPAGRANEVPAYEDLHAGEAVRLSSDNERWVIAEKGLATTRAAEGEIPYRLTPNVVYGYADLSGPGGTFGTLDYSVSPPAVFTGREVTLDDLGVPKTARMREREARQVEGVHLSCPQCGGPLALRAPDRTERVVCPNCAALLDVKQGQLSLLGSLGGDKIEPRIPFGSVGKFPEGEFTLIGFLRRGVNFEGVDYFWEEYLLYEPRLGFRWLVRSDNHWNYVRHVSPGDVSTSGAAAFLGDNRFKLFQKDQAWVTYVAGEFYWKVTVGEAVEAADFIRPPEMLSRELSTTGTEEEINWSLGTYMPVREVEKAFGLTDSLPRPYTVAPNQPFTLKPTYHYWFILTVVAIVIGMIFLVTGKKREVYKNTFSLPREASRNDVKTLGVLLMQNDPLSAATYAGYFVTHPKPSGSEPAREIISEPFELRGRRNLAVTVRSSVDNAGLFVDGELVNLDTGVAQPFSVEVGYYHGVADGESWSEGSREKTVYLSALPEGRYTLRFQVDKEMPDLDASVTIRVEQGVARMLYLVLVLAALAAIPALVAGYHIYFETRRWKDSNCK